MTLQFNEELHKYTWLEEPDILLTSVSTLIGYYHEKFDEDKMSKKVADKRKVSQEQILEEWKLTREKAATKGTLYHAKKEKESLAKSGVFKHPEVNGLKQALDITELKPGIYPELILYHPDYNIVGTADSVEIYSDNTFDLSDFKTNKKLDFSGYPVYNPKTHTREPKKMFVPLSHLEDCHGIHYTLQLSSYAFILEEAGYTPRNLRIDHVQFDEDEQDIMIIPYSINYLKKEVKNMFEHFKSNKSKHK